MQGHQIGLCSDELSVLCAQCPTQHQLAKQTQSRSWWVLYLAVCPGHHTRVKQHQPVASNEVQSTPTSLAAEQEDELVVLWVIELLDQLLALADASAAVQSQEGILQYRQKLSATSALLTASCASDGCSGPCSSSAQGGMPADRWRLCSEALRLRHDAQI